MSTTVFRVEKNREYVVIHHRFLRNKGMSLKAKGLLALCLSLPETWNYSISGLVAICKESQTSMRSALKELEKYGHLKRNRLKDEKGMFYYEYVIYESPYDGFVHAADKIAENVHADNVHTENRIQESKEKESTNKESKEEENKEKEKEDFDSILSVIPNLEVKNLYYEYIEARKGMGAPLTERSLKMLINRCERLSNFNIRVQKILIETAIINGWKNIYLIPEEEIKQANKEVLDELKGFYGGEE